VIAIANTTTGTEDEITYDPFGDIVTQTNATDAVRFGFAGMEYDSTTGLYYDHARYYDAAIGRFTSQDPKSFAAGDTNLYRYVGNQPTTGTDPSGLDLRLRGIQDEGPDWFGDFRRWLFGPTPLPPGPPLVGPIPGPPGAPGAPVPIEKPVEVAPPEGVIILQGPVAGGGGTPEQALHDKLFDPKTILPQSPPKNGNP
jgi:RHS repeat-associated protein